MALGSKNEAQRRAKVQSKQVGLQSVKHDKNVAGTVREAYEEVWGDDQDVIYWE